MEFNFTINYKLFSRLLFLISPTLLILKSLEKFKCFWKKSLLMKRSDPSMYHKWPKTWIEKKLFQDMFFVFTYTAFPKVVKNISSRFSIEVTISFLYSWVFLEKKKYTKNPVPLLNFSHLCEKWTLTETQMTPNHQICTSGQDVNNLVYVEQL